MGGETKRIVEPLELLRVRLIVGCMGPLSLTLTQQLLPRDKRRIFTFRKRRKYTFTTLRCVASFIFIHPIAALYGVQPRFFPPESANFENWYPLESSGPLDFVAPGRGGMGNHVSRSSQNGFFRLDFRLSG